MRLRVDWPACRARGLCFELLPERVALDDWGYPVVTGPVDDSLVRAAREAVTACPTSALRLLPSATARPSAGRGTPPSAPGAAPSAR